MRHLSGSRFAMVLGCLVVLWGQPAAQAKQVEFAVKQATYADTGGVFRCEANLAANDTATLQLTVNDGDADRVFQSIHTNLPAKLSRAAANAKKEVVMTISVASSTAATAGVTFHTTFVVADAYSIRYGVRRSDRDGENAKLYGYLHVHDRSMSSAAWADAKLVIKRPGMDDICHTKISMDTGQTCIAPLAGLTQYPVRLAIPEVGFLRTLGNAAYEVRDLINSGQQTLAAGNIRVMSAKGKSLYATELRANLLPGKKEAIRAVPAIQVAVKAERSEDRWHEARSVADGVLRYRQRSGTETIVKNKRSEPIKIYDEVTKRIETIAPGDERPWFTADRDANPAEAVADLFDLSEQALSRHVTRLKQIVASQQVDLQKLEEVRSVQASILKLDREIKTLTGSIKATVKRIVELESAGAEEAMIQIYKARKKSLASKLDKNKAAFKAKIVELAGKVTELSTDNRSIQAQPAVPSQPPAGL